MTNHEEMKKYKYAFIKLVALLLGCVELIDNDQFFKVYPSQIKDIWKPYVKH